MSELAKVEEGGIPGETLPTQLVLPEELSFEQWQEGISILFSIGKGCMWWIGDAMNYGESHFGEDYSQAIESFDYEQNTLTNAAWVCRNVPPEIRRKELSFSHHDAVASLEKLGEKRKWLNKAVEKRWTRNELRQAISASRLVQGEETEKKPASRPEPRAPDPVDGLRGEGRFQYKMDGTEATVYDVTTHPFEDDVADAMKIGSFDCTGDETWDGLYPSECYAIEACKALNGVWGNEPDLIPREEGEAPSADDAA